MKQFMRLLIPLILVIVPLVLFIYIFGLLNIEISWAILGLTITSVMIYFDVASCLSDDPKLNRYSNDFSKTMGILKFFLYCFIILSFGAILGLFRGESISLISVILVGLFLAVYISIYVFIKQKWLSNSLLESGKKA